MNRRNFFGTVGAVLAGAVLGNSMPPQAEVAFDFVEGNCFVLSTTGNVGLNSVSVGDLYSRTFVADKVNFGDGTLHWGGIDGGTIRLSTVDGIVDAPILHDAPADFDYYDAWL